MIYALIAGSVLAQPTFAIVVGVDKFSQPGLAQSVLDPETKEVRGAKYDAERFAEDGLRKQRMQVAGGVALTGKNATRSRIRELLKAVAEKTKSGGQAVFYFSGLGSCDRAGNASLTTFASESQDAGEDIFLTELADWAKVISDNGATPVIIVDACFPQRGQSTRAEVGAIPGEIDTANPRVLNRPFNPEVVTRNPVYTGPGVRLIAGHAKGLAYAWRPRNGIWQGAMTEIVRVSLGSAASAGSPTYSSLLATAVPIFLMYKGERYLRGFLPGPTTPPIGEENHYRQPVFGSGASAEIESERDFIHHRMRANIRFIHKRMADFDWVSAIKAETEWPELVAIGAGFNDKAPPDVIIELGKEEAVAGEKKEEFSASMYGYDLDGSTMKRLRDLKVSAKTTTSGASLSGLLGQGDDRELSLGDIVRQRVLETRLARAARLCKPTLSSEFTVEVVPGKEASVKLLELKSSEPGFILMAYQREETGGLDIGLPALSEKGHLLTRLAPGQTLQLPIVWTDRKSLNAFWITPIFIADTPGLGMPQLEPDHLLYRSRQKFMKWVIDGIHENRLKWTSTTIRCDFD